MLITFLCAVHLCGRHFFQRKQLKINGRYVMATIMVEYTASCSKTSFFPVSALVGRLRQIGRFVSVSPRLQSAGCPPRVKCPFRCRWQLKVGLLESDQLLTERFARKVKRCVARYFLGRHGNAPTSTLFRRSKNESPKQSSASAPSSMVPIGIGNAILLPTLTDPAKRADSGVRLS